MTWDAKKQRNLDRTSPNAPVEPPVAVVPAAITHTPPSPAPSVEPPAVKPAPAPFSGPPSGRPPKK